MRRLSFLIGLLVLSTGLSAQTSPHGNNLTISCKECHTTNGWKVNLADITFSHNSTKFPLAGQHLVVNCKDCHSSLVFTGTPSDCNSCHTDVHQQTVGPDCSRCHTPVSWLVSNVIQLHQLSRFPLIGPHISLDCSDCHSGLATTSASTSFLRFDPLGTSCYDCHKKNYMATTKPNHVQSNYSTNCTECHSIFALSWNGASINHNFFPLVEGHSIDDCKACHKTGTFEKIPTECVSCHQSDYQSTTNPNHSSLDFSTTCNNCHTLKPGWKPAEFKEHDVVSFPIYSGKHNQQWNTCADCHPNASDYALFTCTNCHEHNKAETDNGHGDVNGYEYADAACYACHPTGSADEGFNHNSTSFPLTGAHTSVACSDCHTNGYAGTSSECSSCHTNNYNQTTNPNHSAIGIPTDCGTCHTTDPNWKPAKFPIHDNYYALQGAHLAIAEDCFTCHSGVYTNSPRSCYTCHSADYEKTSDPSHVAANFPQTCQDCHSQTAWKPSTFEHDGNYFPIYSGKHNGQWNSCADCHTNPQDFSIFSCIDCHEHNKTETDDNHQGINGYEYASNACFACHPTGSATGSFEHSSTGFPLTGSHTSVSCSGCHTNGYTGTSSECSSCHTSNYNQTTNPNHNTIGIPTDCGTCHTTDPDWKPAKFPIHDNYYALQGAHLAIAGDCFTCHSGVYTNSPRSCYTCHSTVYEQTSDPSHVAANFPQTCEDCHSQSAWKPSTFEHDGNYFPIYSGSHNGQWNSCAECHTNSQDFSLFSCVDCHEHNKTETDNNHQGVNGYEYLSNACYVCHPTGSATGSFEHSSTGFPLTGSHTLVNCTDCHTDGYTGTSSECSSCHNDNYNQTTNPNHNAIGIPTDCATCHTADPDWKPAKFPIHDNYYALQGAHLAIADECFTCHNGIYTNPERTCYTCHSNNYNQTTNPSHLASLFPHTCEDCHTQTAWTPSTFNHDGNYFPIYSGKHAGEWTYCSDCHTNTSDYAVFTCTTACHPQTSTNNDHSEVSGYTYNSAACYNCHPTGRSDKKTNRQNYWQN